MRELTAKEAKRVRRAMHGHGGDQEKVVEYVEGKRTVVITRGGERPQDDGFRCLMDGKWLNDETIEVYLRLIVKRSRDHVGR